VQAYTSLKSLCQVSWWWLWWMSVHLTCPWLVIVGSCIRIRDVSAMPQREEISWTLPFNFTDSLLSCGAVALIDECTPYVSLAGDRLFILLVIRDVSATGMPQQEDISWTLSFNFAASLLFHQTTTVMVQYKSWRLRMDLYRLQVFCLVIATFTSSSPSIHNHLPCALPPLSLFLSPAGLYFLVRRQHLFANGLSWLYLIGTRIACYLRCCSWVSSWLGREKEMHILGLQNRRGLYRHPLLLVLYGLLISG